MPIQWRQSLPVLCLLAVGRSCAAGPSPPPATPPSSQAAPSSVLEAIAHILLAKLYRKPIAPAHNDRYRRYTSSEAVSRPTEQTRQTRGRKQIKSLAAVAAVSYTLFTNKASITSLKDFAPDDRIAVPAFNSPQAILLRVAGRELYAYASGQTIAPVTFDATGTRLFHGLPAASFESHGVFLRSVLARDGHTEREVSVPIRIGGIGTMDAYAGGPATVGVQAHRLGVGG